jgi:helicase
MTNTVTAISAEPRFRGLFVGINKYQSADISNLASAVRDAAALHALFSDNLGDNCSLVTDSDATTDRVRRELAKLQTESTGDDVVVIAFSGHGSDTHQLVAFDTDLNDLAGTALPLSELTELVSAVPAKHLLVVLDCCFSGSAGAKVLHAPGRSRGGSSGLPLSTEAFLNQMAGTGRVILTASTADQAAWEDVRLGHGYLSYYLMQALLGPGEVENDGKVNLHDLLKYVTANVKASASGTYNALQEPTLRGQWDGEVIWPVFVPGPLYTTLYPPATAEPVTDAIQSLASHGLPDLVLQAWATAVPRLNQLQQDAINEAGLFVGRNVLVIAPTSSGKTMIGELAAMRATQVGGRAVFLLPTKALVNEQYERFRRVYGPAGVRVIQATGDHNDDVPALLRGQFDIAIFTYEKFSGLALAQSYLLRLVSVIVVDEVQTIVDASRGRELELLLTLIKSRKDEGIEPQLIVLSAVIGQINGLDSWLEAYLLRSDLRPVTLEEGVLNSQGLYRYIDAAGSEQVTQLTLNAFGDPRARTLLIPLVRQLVAEGQQVIVIRGERGPARGAAVYLAQALGLPPADDALRDLPDGDPTLSTSLLRQSLQGGVAFHISDLSPDERRVVEEQFRRPNSQVRVIVATTTLAQGVNMPAETVVMPELSRRTGRATRAWYSVADYKNIAGRAGRLGLTERGRSIVLAYDGATVNYVWNTYITGAPGDVHSTLLGQDVDLYTVVLRVVAIAAGRSDDRSTAIDDLAAILANSLAAHQARIRGASEVFDPDQIAAAIAELQRVGFLETLKSGRTRLSPLGSLVAESALAVRSAIRVANVLRRMRPEELNQPTILAIAQITLELDAMRLTVNAKGIQPELRTFVGGLVSRRVAPAVVDALEDGASDRIAVAARAKKAIACLLWTNGVPLGKIEQFVMQHYFDRNASGPIGSVVSRTHDVVGAVLAMAAEIHPTGNITNLIRLLPVQLEIGIPEGLAPLAIASADLRREDYLRLSNGGLTTAEVIDQADNKTLLPLLGGNAEMLASLRNAIELSRKTPVVPTLEDLMGDAS